MEQIEASRTALNNSPINRKGKVENINIIIWNKKGKLR